MILYDEDKSSDGDEDTDVTPKAKASLKFSQLFEPLRILGSGGFGVVVACKERQSGRKVALKIAQLNR
jgi:serine/threonine protein kinase